MASIISGRLPGAYVPDVIVVAPPAAVIAAWSAATLVSPTPAGAMTYADATARAPRLVAIAASRPASGGTVVQRKPGEKSDAGKRSMPSSAPLVADGEIRSAGTGRSTSVNARSASLDACGPMTARTPTSSTSTCAAAITASG